MRKSYCFHMQKQRCRSDAWLNYVVRKPAFCICKNKDADHLFGNTAANKVLYFHYMDRTILVLPKSKISRLWLYRWVCAGPGRKPRRQAFSLCGSFCIFRNVVIAVTWDCKLAACVWIVTLRLLVTPATRSFSNVVLEYQTRILINLAT